MIFSVAVATAAGLVGSGFFLLPKGLDVHTDIVGYPTVYNFNNERYLWAYLAIVGAFPLVTAALYLFLRRTIAPGPAEPLGVIELLDRQPPPDHGEASRTASAAARVLFVGLALGLEAAICLDQNSVPVIPLTILVGLAYGVLATGAALLARVKGRGRSGYELLSAINALAAPATVLGLAWVSTVTKVTVASDSRVHRYPWFPWWLAVPIAVALCVCVIRALRRAGPAEYHRVERRVLFAVVAPVVLFVFVAALPGAPGDIDSFDEGERLGAAHLIQAGRFPWRDLLFIHGLLGDVAQPLLGLSVFGDTRWGNLAGQSMLVAPASWLGLYALCAYLFRRNWLFLLGTQLAVVTGWVFAVQTRFVFVPFVILLLVALLRQATWPRAIAFTTLLAVHAIASPEGSYAVPAYLLAVLCFDLAAADRGHGLVRRLRRTTMCGLAGLVVVALWFGFLAIEHSAGDFIFYYRTFAPGHALTGALPIALGIGGAGTQWGGDWYYRFAAAAPIALVLLTVWYFAARVRSARSIPVDDWAMGATAVFLGLYYVKFLDRSDHVYQPFALAIPVLFYVVYRIVSAVEALPPTSRRPRWLPARHWVTLPLVAVILLAPPKSLTKTVDSVAYRFAASVTAEPPLPRVGYVLNTDPLFHSVFAAPPKTIDASLVTDVSTTMHAYLRPGDRLFDLSNNPALFWYLLRLPLATRYYHVSMAIREHTQHDLIAQLRRQRPRLVVFSSDWIGLPYWDGIPNEVRHYAVSRYVLDHYRPLLWSHGLLVLVRNGEHPPPVSEVAPRLAERPKTTDLYFRTFSCDWGYAPDFLSVRPPSEAGLTLSSKPHSPGVIALDLPAQAGARYGWLEVESTSTFGATRFVLTDRLASADARRQVAFTTRGGTSVIRVQVGSCAQWHGYHSHTLYLGTDPTQQIRAVRLVP